MKRKRRYFGKIETVSNTMTNIKVIKMSGYLEIVFGPMFSGKTTKLIQVYKNYTYIGEKVVVINYSKDKRYHDEMLSTHDKMMIPCLFAEQLSFLNAIEANVILINEAQFFPDLYEFVLDMVERHHKKVYIYGLDGDFQREKFGRMLDLIPFCDHVEKLQSLCAICRNGTKALFSHRISEETSQIVIGSDNYVPLCRLCYLSR